MKKPKLLILCVLLTTMLPAQNRALIFDGTNNYINCGTGFDGNAIRTMECWVKFSSLIGAQEILSQSSAGKGIELVLYNNALNAYCMKSGYDYSNISYPLSNLTKGVWYHLAFTWDGTKEGMKLYVNDKIVGTRTDVGDINMTGVAAIDSFLIGNWSHPSSRFLKASVDEIRIWNTTRTASEIKSGMYGTVAANTPGLLAMYNCNEGAGTTIANSSSSAAMIPGSNGALMNGTAWLAVSPVQGNDNGLSFDGINDFVTAPANADYDFTSGTIECWIRTEDFTGNACILRNGNNITTRYSFHISSSSLGMYNGSSYNSIPYVVIPGQWYHLAFVCTPSATTIYVNGISIGITENVTGTATGLPLQIGMRDTSTLLEPFPGIIDELRIWNVAITPAQITANMNMSLTGTEENLVGLFGLNQGIPGDDNDGLKTAIEGTVANNHGTLHNFTLNGNISNWVSHTLSSPLSVTGLSFAATKRATVIQLNWSTLTESNTRSFDVEKSADGRNFIVIGTVNAAGLSGQKTLYSFEDKQPIAGANYYRLKQADLDGNTKLTSVVIINWQDQIKINITVTPQPLHTIANVSMAGVSIDGWFVIYDVNGKKIKKYQVKEGSSSFQVNRSGMPPGVYFYKLITSKGEIKGSGKISAD